MQNEYRQFLKKSGILANDESHRLKILKAVSTHQQQVDKMTLSQFRDWDQACKSAAEIKKYVLDYLPTLLQEFEQKITARGTKVLWAQDKNEARQHFLDIFARHQAKKVVKSKSMTTEEIEFNELCEENGMEVLESDLGELIVQLAGEKPYHLVTPAMHLTRSEIGKLFQDRLGAPATEDATELTMIARDYLRNAYITSDIGVTGANFIIANDGAVVMTENEGNGRLTMACPETHVVIVGIEKVIPRLTDLALFLPLLSTSGTGQQITGYNSIIRGPRQIGETDGPENMYVILLDNGRSELYQKDIFRSVLSCIRCGACLNACPVYRTIGGHTYHTTYQGPIGSVLTPQFRGMDRWGHLSFASSLCAACSTVCPVDIDIHQLLLENRWETHKSKQTGRIWNWGLSIWALVMSKRSRLNFAARFARLIYKFLLFFIPKNKRKRLPDLPSITFAEMWEKYDK